MHSLDILIGNKNQPYCLGGKPQKVPMGRKTATVIDGPSTNRASIAVASRSRDSILILCPTATRSSGVLEALYALYFLPDAYRVRVEGRSDLLLEEIYKLFRDDALATRIDWSVDDIDYSPQEKAGEASPFSLADVVVYGNAQAAAADAPSQSLVVFNLAARQPGIEEDHRFTVCPSSPEALASAILQVTR